MSQGSCRSCFIIKSLLSTRIAEFIRPDALPGSDAIAAQFERTVDLTPPTSPDQPDNPISRDFGELFPALQFLGFAAVGILGASLSWASAF